jgi:hypothetical protein
MSNTSFTFVSLKSFGDLVITRWAIERLAPIAAAKIRLLIGSHLVELNSALGEWPGTEVIEHGGGNVPAFFAARQYGVRTAAANGLILRKALRRAFIPSETTLVFDRIKIRERFLAFGSNYTALPSTASNIYQAYEDFLRPLVQASEPPPLNGATQSKPASLIGIFPDSRIANKRMSAATVIAISRICNQSGIPYKVYLLEGEPSDLCGLDLNITAVPRHFASMINAVRGTTAVISADSMPAHLAEYFNIPVFVISPKPNVYWLPKSCFDLQNWSLFTNQLDDDQPFKKFLSGC